MGLDRVFITGASTGLGEGLARHYAEKGATLGLVARREELLSAHKEAFEKLGATVHIYPRDVADTEGMQSAIDDFLEQVVNHLVRGRRDPDSLPLLHEPKDHAPNPKDQLGCVEHRNRVLAAVASLPQFLFELRALFLVLGFEELGIALKLFVACAAAQPCLAAGCLLCLRIVVAF